MSEVFSETPAVLQEIFAKPMNFQDDKDRFGSVFIDLNSYLSTLTISELLYSHNF